MMVGSASVASAAIGQILYDSHGFEASANLAINYSASFNLIGQPVGAAAQDKWAGATAYATGSLNTSVPAAGVFAYIGPTAPNFQYALVQAPNVASGGYGYFAPNTNNPAGGGTAYTPAANEQIAITFSMNAYSFGAAGGAFFGLTAFSGVNEVASVGIDNSTGNLALPLTATTHNGGFTAQFDRFYGYELLLNYATQTWSIYTDPLTGPGAGTFTLRASGPFATTTTTFTDADLATYGLTANAFSGYAAYDDYKVQVVPEPASIGALGLAFGLLAARRRKTSK